jgi:hypothetical protein
MGRGAVVTGAASGIGRALALALAGQGCKLALVDVHRERLDELAALIPGVSVHVIGVSDRDVMLGINLWGVIHGCHGFRPHLVTREAVLPDRAKRVLPVWANRWGAGLISRALGLTEAQQAHIAEYRDGR